MTHVQRLNTLIDAESATINWSIEKGILQKEAAGGRSTNLRAANYNVISQTNHSHQVLESSTNCGSL